jgi:hypothetical protein
METFHFLFQNNIDVEYNKYILLDQLQKSARSFEKQALFPYYKQLLKQYTNLVQLKESIDQMNQHFYRDLNAIDVKNQKLSYSEPLTNHFAEQYQLVEEALPTLKKLLNQGKYIHDIAKQNMNMRMVGLEPVYTKEGLLLIYEKHIPAHHLFYYSTYIIEDEHEDYADFKTTYIQSFVGKSPEHTSEQIKYNYIQKHQRAFPAPVTYLVELESEIPVIETALPIAREMLLTKTK